LALNLEVDLLDKETGTFFDYLETHASAKIKVPNNREMNKTWLLGGKSKSARKRVLLFTLHIQSAHEIISF
jgi:hypothetical protein